MHEFFKLKVTLSKAENNKIYNLVNRFKHNRNDGYCKSDCEGIGDVYERAEYAN